MELTTSESFATTDDTENTEKKERTQREELEEFYIFDWN